MDGFMKIYFKCLGSKVYLPAFALMVFLSRSPVLKMLVEKQFSLAPRAAHLLKWITGTTAMVGSVDSVTGATATVKLLPGYDDTTGILGEYFRLSFASTDYVVGSYRLGGAAPPGLALSPIVNEFGVGTIDGVPTRKGVYNVDIWAYKENNQTGDSTLLAITVRIVEKGPNITKHPQSVSLPWGSALNLDVSIQQPIGATYQWRKDGTGIPGATLPNYQASQVTTEYEGLYDVQITQDGLTVLSNSASVSIMASGIQLWKESEFADPFDQSTDALNDPDLDGLINLVEYAIGTDPLAATVIQLPAVSREQSILGDYVVYTYRKNPAASDITITAEYSDALRSENWTQLFNLQNGILIEENQSSYVVKVPKEEACFVRFRISDSQVN
jgi:hypothetical protein